MSSPGCLDILILGADRVGQVLARAWARSGHDVTFGARDPESAKTREVVTATLAAEVGLEAVDVGALKMARLLEPMALLWIELAYGAGWGADFCFDVIRRPIEAAT